MTTLNEAIQSVVGYNHINDDLRAHFLANGASSGTLDELELQFLSAVISSPDGKTLEDLWMEALTAKGITSGSINDRFRVFWSTYNGVF